MRVQARRAANAAAIARNWPRGSVHNDGAPECIYVERCHHKTRGAALMDAIWARASSGTLRGALMLDAAWHLQRARDEDTPAWAAYELERAATARRALEDHAKGAL